MEIGQLPQAVVELVELDLLAFGDGDVKRANATWDRSTNAGVIRRYACAMRSLAKRH